MRTGGDVDYDARGIDYSTHRRSDPRIEALIRSALGTARSVVNVGAGAGSYEPADRYVVAIEPSAAMRAQRPPDRVPAVHGCAEALPLDDRAVDAAMALVTVHQWSDLAKGLSELRRVARGPVVVLTFDVAALDRWWLADYVPELLAVERRRYPAIGLIAAAVGPVAEIHEVAIPIDCSDGFIEAFYARPEALLERAVRQAQSAWGFVAPDVEARFTRQLGEDLATGRWQERYGEWRRRSTFAGSLRLIIGRPGG